jgi:hypothetical protein
MLVHLYPTAGRYTLENKTFPSDSTVHSYPELSWFSSFFSGVCSDGTSKGIVPLASSTLTAASPVSIVDYASFSEKHNNNNNNNNKNSVARVRERTIPTERPPLVGEVSVKFLRIEGCRVVSAADPLRP